MIRLTFHPFTFTFSLVILLTVYYAILMMLDPLIDIFIRSHLLSA